MIPGPRRRRPGRRTCCRVLRQRATASWDLRRNPWRLLMLLHKRYGGAPPDLVCDALHVARARDASLLLYFGLREGSMLLPYVIAYREPRKDTMQ